MSNNDLSGVIAAYLQAVDNGERPVPEDWIERHPELEDDLRQFFADQQQMANVAVPLREVDSDAETTEGHDRSSTEELPENVRYFGDYNIEREIARGGMGIVYRARQVSLNRPVALKMIRAGQFADETDVRRFRDEAEAAANLDHPNVVPIYEVGEHEGRHYFSMKLIEGGSLAMHLPRYRNDPNATAQLMITVAQAVHHAHQRGILHRDLKPENVLIDTQGQPHVTDFGLAKRLESKEGMTESGARVGTLAFMSPEQALGEKALTIAVDVYGLGAILYVLLTGRPPFESENVVETLRGITENEPERPSGVDRDLETICLKSLQKEPHRRYASAGELVEDLQRYQRGEPITARPVGRREKVIKWVRRNPAMASVLTLLVLVLILGATTSTVLAVLANRRAEEATKAKHKAERETQKAIASKEEAERAKDELMTSVARSLGRPLAPLIDPKNPLTPLRDPEIEALLELSETTEEKIRLRFVEESFRSSTTTRQLRDRGDYALRAVAGLDRTRRLQIEQAFLKQLQTSERTEEQRLDIALLLAKLGDCDPRTAIAVISYLVQARDHHGLGPLKRTLPAVMAKMEPQHAAQAAAIVTQALSREEVVGSDGSVAEELSALATRMTPKAAATMLTQSMNKTEDSFALAYLSTGLSAVAAKMQPEAAAEVCSGAADILTRIILKRTDDNSLSMLVLGLSELAPRMKPEQVVKVASILIQTMKKAKDSRSLGYLSEGLPSLVARMNPEEAIRACVEAATILMGHAARIKPQKGARAGLEPPPMFWRPPGDFPGLYNLCKGLSALAAKMEPHHATKAADILTQAMTKTTNPPDLQYLAQTLSDVAVIMEPKEAAQACSRAVGILVQRVPKSGNGIFSLAVGLIALSERMQPMQDAEIVAALILTMNNTTDAFVLHPLAERLSLIAARMEPEKAAQVCSRATGILDQAITKTTDSLALWHLSDGLIALASGMEPKEATQARARAMLALISSRSALLPGSLSMVTPKMSSQEAVDVAILLTQAMKDATTGQALRHLAQGVSALASEMEPSEATEACSRATTILTAEIPGATDARSLNPLCQGLSELAVRLKPEQSAEVARVLTQAMNKTEDPLSLGILSEALASIAVKMKLNEAAQACSQASGRLTRALTQTQPTEHGDLVDVLTALTKGLSHVASGMEPKEAADVLIRAMSQLMSPDLETGLASSVENAVRELARGLTKVAARLEPKEAAETCSRAADILIRAMTTATDASQLQILAEGVATLATRMQPREAAQVCSQAAAILTKAAMGSTSSGSLISLSRGLSLVAAKMKPKEAAQVCSQVTIRLAQALTKNPDPQLLRFNAEAVLVAAIWMEPGDVAPVAALLAQAMTKTTDSAIREPLAKELSELLEKRDFQERAQQARSAATILGQMSGFTPAVSAPVLLTPALQPFPCRLSTQQLVDLLKNPFCVGQAERVVLDHLQNRYGEKFGNVWDFVHYAHRKGLKLDFRSPPTQFASIP